MRAAKDKQIGWRFLIAVSGLSLLLGSSPAPQPASLVLRNGKILTVDPAKPRAQAVALSADRIVAVGTNEEIDAYVGPSTEVIDLSGKLAVPGFVEGHGHFLGLGRSKMVLDLTRVENWDEIVSMVKEAAAKAKPGDWILGRGWHQEKWDNLPSPNVEGLPLHHELSQVSPENPVLLTHASGHASFANRKALELADIGKETPDPPGGTIVRDGEGNPTGALREKAQGLVREANARYERSRPAEARRADELRAVELAGAECLKYGVTSFQDAGSNFETIEMFKELAEQGKLPLRLYVMVRNESNETMAQRLPEYKMVNAAGGFLTVRSIKRQIDGALGAHGAWLLAPYADLGSTSGLVLEPPEDIARTVEIAIRHGFQVNTHAIGDRGNRETLDIYEKAFRAAGVKGGDLRFRIEHAQHIDPQDLPRFAQLGVIASMQGNHCTSDGPWVPRRLGDERAGRTSYLWRSLIDSGAVVTNGTDVPVEPVDPLVSFYAAVTRNMKNGQLFYPEQKMTREEALKAYTLNGAYAAFEEGVKGSISPGKYADIVVLSKDIMSVPEEEILEARVVYTILGGKIRYRSQSPTNE
jgi:predicted amidohydrolase YtcJ